MFGQWVNWAKKKIYIHKEKEKERVPKKKKQTDEKIRVFDELI